jgi:hypothetical protein
MKIVQKILSHNLTKEAIKSSSERYEVLDKIESLIIEIDDTSLEGALIFDALEEGIDLLLKTKK